MKIKLKLLKRTKLTHGYYKIHLNFSEKILKTSFNNTILQLRTSNEYLNEYRQLERSIKYRNVCGPVPYRR